MGCSNVAELETTVREQDERIVELEEQLEEQAQLIVEQQGEIEAIMQEDEGSLSGREQWYQMYQRSLAHDLMENIEDLTIEFLGGSAVSLRDEADILFPNIDAIVFGSSNYVVARVRMAYVILSYEIIGQNEIDRWVDWNWDDIQINWEVIAYVVQGGIRLVEERIPR